jgi:hypothetical protein
MGLRLLLFMNPFRFSNAVPIFSFALICSGVFSLTAAEYPPNPGFEDGIKGWRPLWMREPDAGTLAIDTRTIHGGKSAVKIEYKGEKDWSFEPASRVKVAEGDVWEWSGWVKVAPEQRDRVTLCASIYNAKEKVDDWVFGGTHPAANEGWQRVCARFVIPAGIMEIQPRIIGGGVVTFWLDDFVLEKKYNVLSRRSGDLKKVLTLSNSSLIVSLNVSNATLSVVDRRTDRHYEQKPIPDLFVIADANLSANRIDYSLLDPMTDAVYKTSVRLDGDQPEFTVELAGGGELRRSLRYPYPFVTGTGSRLIVPMNEGISYPVEDESIREMRLIAYGGHGICMAFWGVTEGEGGQMTILETSDDATIRIARNESLLYIAPEWDAQHGRFGYTRRLRYVFFERGGYVAMAKRYRAYAQKIGLFKTLEQKRQENPNVDRLIGAVNVWCWDKNGLVIVKEMQAAGIGRILWSNAQSPENLKALNAMGVLTSRYDIYQDAMNPETFPLLRYTHPDWTSAGWPKDMIIDSKGDWLRGWEIEGKDGKMYPCGTLCDKLAPDYARKRITAELATHPYLCRFIDTTTAAPWRECYSPDHPMTRSDSRHWKMELLRYVSQDCHLVVGCETGHDAAVPYLHYFEGMMSLGPYRVPDAGRAMDRIWDEVPPDVAKFQMGHEYRLPLWELVYHDCVVAQWYWGDYNNKLPALWDKRDLFNILYANGPMFMFNRELWNQKKDRFVQSYKNICPLLRSVGYSEMTDHRILNADRSVQQSAFSNGTTVTVNFGAKPFTLPDGAVVGPMGFRIQPAK